MRRNLPSLVSFIFRRLLSTFHFPAFVNRSAPWVSRGRSGPAVSARRAISTGHWSLITDYFSLFSALFILFLLASCSSPTPIPTLTPFPDTPTSLAPSPEPPTATATATAVPAPARALYTMNVVLDYAAKSVAVDETILYPNHTGQPLNDLVLAVEPNFWPNCFTLGSLSLDNEPVTDYTLDGQKLSFPLASALSPEATVTLHVQYALALPQIEPNPNLPPRIFGFTSQQINLTNWYPFVVPNINGEWVLHDPVGFASEHLVYDAADFVINVKPADPAVAPVIATSGARSQNGEWTTYTLTEGRTFALSASTDFLSSSVQVGDVTLTSYYFPGFEGASNAAMNASAQAIQVYSQRYGPYPHKTLAIVMGDFSDSKEFSALYFHSRNFYQLYDGTIKNYLTFVAAHETAHQWWFEQVANDQAEQPWLDEALATYSEHVFYEGVDHNLIPWWWAYRIDYYNPEGWVDSPIYAFYTGDPFDSYRNAVYFRGAHFLDDLRKRIGDDAFFAFLQDYLAQEKGKIATASDFFRILAAHTTVDYSDLVRQYFQNVY